MVAKIVRCKSPFAFEDNGMTRVLPAGALVSSDDVAFKQFKDYFEDVETHVDQQRKLAAAASNRDDVAPVEQATAAPGEKRTTVRPVASSQPASKPTAAAGGSANDATVKANGPKPK